MRIEQLPNGDARVYVRQSWLKDAIMCPERGRFAMHPETSTWSRPNELTAIGTAVHASIERHLSVPDAQDCVEYGINVFDEIANGDMRWNKYNESQCKHYISSLFGTWINYIKPEIRGEVLGVERKFDFFLHHDVTPQGKNIYIHGEGTIDLVTDQQLWDWKTASRKYNEKEKQATDIQSTMYVAAAQAMGYVTELPATFSFGVLVRGGATQKVDVTRTTADLAWLKRLIIPYARQACSEGIEMPWAANDTHYLCNSTWCPYWSVCRGAYS